MATPLIDYKIVLEKAMKYCAYQERCQWELERKFYDWQVDFEIRDQVMSELITQGFINEERFANQFASGKFRMKCWGKQKIKTELKARQISSYSINKALNNISDEEYNLALHNLIKRKESDIRAKSEFEKKQKLAQFLFGKGYETELIWSALESTIND
ncbi:MAG: RecX family transcriptional regulator [Bacteroidales bacterium]|nr:RecX family transcriptional regulator [Bacteroidales bacterium]